MTSPGSVQQPSRGPYAKSAARRAEIISAATAVFGSRGYRGGSLRQIAAQIGLSLTTVMHHFPTKASLLAAVLAQEDAADTDFLLRSSRDGFIQTVLAIVERNLERRELVRMFTVLQAESTHADHEAHAWLEGRYASVVPQYCEAIEHDRAVGRIRASSDASMLATLVIGMWEGVQVRWLADDTDPVEAMRVALDALLEPVSNPPRNSVETRSG